MTREERLEAALREIAQDRFGLGLRATDYEQMRCWHTHWSRCRELARAALGAPPDDDVETPRRLLRAILAADERGQGLPYAEAMDAAHEYLRRTAPPPAAERPSGLHCDYAGASCLQGCATHGWCRRDPNPPPSYVQGSPFTRYADGAWWLPAAEEPAARVSERGEGRGASTGLADALASLGAALVEAQRPTPEWLADAERGFVGAV